ncbi:hypothetical protein [Bradyrhizobium oligotrophicum]|uniref:hypothetical protein n=1 Tax=Bradyrhizobium oligotrophicum TaxID=44255 RepID=UPI003EB80C68
MPVQEEAKMEKKIKARVQKTKRVFVHNDLAQAAQYFADTIREKLDKGTRDAIMFDGMACAVMVAFTFEANVNFMGFELNKAGKLPNWKERESFMEKLKKVFGALGIPVELDKRPLKSMERMKNLRDTLAHGKPVYAEYDEVEIGTAEQIDIRAGAKLAAGWETECRPDVVKEANADLDELWKLMIEKSGLDLWDTMTSGDGGITFIEHVDPNTPSTVPKDW